MALLGGVVLVLLAWAVSMAVVIVIGSPIAGLLARETSAQLRLAIWWGLGAVTVVVLALSLVGALAGAVGLTLGVVAVVALLIRTRLPRATGPLIGGARSSRPLLAALAAAMVFLGLVTLGPVTNYDTGLYHLGLIHYQAEFGVVPGLANLYEALGYSSSVFPLAAALGDTGWGEAGFRLLGGLTAAFVALELALRLLRGSRSPGTYALALGVTVTWMPLIAIGDFWIASPTSDTSVMLLTTVAVAYLADGLRRDSSAGSALATASLLATLTVAMRPTMLPFALALWAVALVVAWRSKASAWRSLAAAGAFAAVIGALQLGRDAVLSGWLLYPFSLLPLDVPWLAPDPWQLRTATLGNARDPSATWASAEGWDWIGPWLSRAPAQWETWLLALLVLTALALALGALRRRWTVDWLGLWLTCVPSAIAVIVWFVAAPPSYRFIWGPLFMLPIVPIAFIVAAWAGPARTPAMAKAALIGPAAVLLSVTAVSLAFRVDFSAYGSTQPVALGPLTVSVPVAPLPEPTVAPQTLASGLVVDIPTAGEQCWARYPLCSPRLVPTVRMLGPTIADGFGS